MLKLAKRHPKIYPRKTGKNTPGQTGGYFITILPSRAAAALDKVFTQDSEEKEEMETDDNK